jgi:hypothetical protein
MDFFARLTNLQAAPSNVETKQLEHVSFRRKQQGSKRCPAHLRRARAGSVRSAEIAVNEKT